MSSTAGLDRRWQVTLVSCNLAFAKPCHTKRTAEPMCHNKKSIE
jgi:hypothetical protein